MLSTDLLEAWLEARRPFWRPSTVKTMTAAVATLRHLLDGNAVDLDALTAQRIIVVASERYARETVVSLRRAWKSAWNWAIRFDVHPGPNPWTPTEVPPEADADIGAARALLSDEDPIDPVPALIAAAWTVDPLLALFIELGAITGCRAGELRALQWADFSTDARKVVIAKAMSLDELRPTKTSDVALLHIPVRLAERIRFMRAAPDAWVFPSQQRRRAAVPWDRAHPARRMKKLCAELGLPPVTPKHLRRWCATTLAVHAGAEAARQRLRHTTVTTTLAHYIQASTASDVASAELLELAVGGG